MKANLFNFRHGPKELRNRQGGDVPMSYSSTVGRPSVKSRQKRVSLHTLFALFLMFLGLGFSSQAWASLYVAGDAGLCGSSWSCTNNNKFSSSSSGGTVTFRGVAAGTYKYKISDGSNWSGADLCNSATGTVSKGSMATDNQMQLVVSSKSDITFTLVSGWDFTVVGVSFAYYLAGDGWCGDSWSTKADNCKMTQNQDGSWSKTISSVNTSAHKFKISTYDWGTSYGYSNYNVQCSSNQGVVADDNGNIQFTLANAGDVTITFYPNDGNKICITGPTPPETKYTVSVSAGDNGSVSPSSVSDVGQYTKSADITATPNTCYKFVDWTLPSGVTAADGYTSTSNPIKINATAASKTITANFEARYYLRGAAKDGSGNKGMPGWNNDAPFVKDGSGNFVLNQTLVAGTVYKFMIYDKKADKQKGCTDNTGNAVIPWNTAWSCNGDYQICFTANVNGAHTFTITQDGENPRVTVTPPSQTIDLYKDGEKIRTIAATFGEAFNKTVLTLPDDTTKTGYTFGGFYDVSAKTGGKQVIAKTLARYGNNGTYGTSASPYTWCYTEATLDAYARYTPNIYTVTLLGGGGDGDTNGSATAEYDSGAGLKNITEPTKKGYMIRNYAYYAESTLDNKVANKSGSYPKTTVTGFLTDGSWTKAANCSLYTAFIPDTFYVQFNANGGSGSMDNEKFIYDEAKALTKNTFTKSGYTFAGWATSAEGDVVYSDQQSVSNLASTNNAVVPLYAKWTPKTYTINLNKQSGSGGTSSLTVQFERKNYSVNPVEVPTRNGYIFLGYFIGNDTTKTKVIGTDGKFIPNAGSYTNNDTIWIKNLDDNSNTKTLYAGWRPTKTTITLYRNGENDTTTSLSARYDCTIAQVDGLRPALYTREGYTHKGIYAARTGGSYLMKYNGEAWAFQSVSGYCTATYWRYEAGGDLNLYSQWQANQYAITLNKNNGEAAGSTTNTFDSKPADVAVPTKEVASVQQIFDGYYTKDGSSSGDWGYQVYTNGGKIVNNAGEGTITDASGNWKSTSITDLYAKWEAPKKVIVTFGITSGTDSVAGRGTITATIKGTGTPITSGVDSITAGTVITLTYTPAKGSYIDVNGWASEGWYNNRVIAGAQKYQNSGNTYDYTVPTVNSEVFVNAPAVTNTFAVVVAAGQSAMGGVSPAQGTAGPSVQQQIVATANPGYDFTGWTQTGSNFAIVNASADTTQVALKNVASETITANFQIHTYTIAYTLNDGTNDPANPTSYVVTDGTITLQPATRTGYDFKGWYESAEFAGDPVTTIVPSTALRNYSLYAKFTEHDYTITMVVSPEGTGKIDPATKTDAHLNEPFTVTATPYTGYSFVKWTSSKTGDKDDISFIYQGVGGASAPKRTLSIGDNTQETPDGNATLVNPNNATLTANFKEVKVKIVPTVNEVGTTAGKTASASVDSIGITTTSVLTASAPGTGFTFTGWTLSSNLVLESGELTSTTITVRTNGDGAAVSAEAVYAEDLSTTWTLGYQGTDVTWSESTAFAKHTGESAGSVAYCTATLDANKHYQFKVINNATPKTYYGNTNSKDGDTPSEKWWIKGTVENWTFETEKENCNMRTTVAGTYTFKVDYSGSNPKVSVYYPTSYTVNYGSNLSVVPNMTSGSVVEPGTQLVFTATNREADGYTFGGFFKNSEKTDSVDVGVVSGYTYTVTPTADIHVHAKYTATAYAITYVMNIEDATNPNPATYTVEAAVNLQPASKSGWAFKGWYDNEGLTGSAVTTIAAGSTGAKTLYAKWVQEGLYLNVKYAENDWRLFRMNDNDGTSITKEFAKGQTYTFSIREVINGQEYIWWKHDGTWTGTDKKALSTSGNDGKFTTLSAIDGNYTFEVDKSGDPYQLTITYPSFTSTVTPQYTVVPNNQIFTVTIAPSVVGFTPTYKLFVQKNGAGDWAEVTNHVGNVYSYKPSETGTLIFKARAYAGESSDYLESDPSETVTVASLELSATRQTIPVNVLNTITPTTNVTGTYYICYKLKSKPAGSAKTDGDIQKVAETNKVSFAADVVGDYKIIATLRTADCGVAEGRDLAIDSITITAVEQYKVYFKKAAKDWGTDAYVYYNVTWDDQHGVTNYQEGSAMTLVDGETDVYVANVPDITVSSIVFGAKWFEKSTTFTECLVAKREDFNKDYSYFVQDPQYLDKFGTCYSYGDGRWFRYATDKGYTLHVGGNNYDLVFPSEASIVPNVITLNGLAGNQTLDLTLTNAQGTTFYLPAYLEISNKDSLVMTTTDNGNKFLTAIAGNYDVTIKFNERVMPAISSTFPEVPAPAATFTEKRYNGDTEMAAFISGDGTEGNPYKFFTDEKMTLTISALPEVKGLAAQYKFGDAEASETNTVDITSATATAVTPITMETYYKKDAVETAHTTKTIYYQVVGVPALHLTTDATGNEVNYDTEFSFHVNYGTDNYSGAATITLNGAVWQTVTAGTTSHAYPVAKADVAGPMFLKFKATATYGGREFKDSVKVVAYRNVLVKMEDVNDTINAQRVHMWRNGAGSAEGTIWPGIEFTTLFGHWKIFNMKYPVYDRWIVNDNDIKKYQTVTQSIDGTDTEICCKTGTSEIGENNKRFFQVIYDVPCPGHILVDSIGDQKVDKDASILVAPNVYLMTGVKESDITMVITTDKDSIVTVTQNGMALLVTGNKAGETTVTVKGYYHKGQDDQEIVTRTFKVTVTAMITIQVKYNCSDLGWCNVHNNNTYIHYWGKDINIFKLMTYKDKVGAEDRFYARIPLDTTGIINFQIGYPDGTSWYHWRQTDDVTGVDKSGCYTITSRGDNQNRVITRDGDYCWTNTNYQVLINMNNGTEYRSNKLTSTEGTLSFFAPGKNEIGYKGGLVRLMNDGIQLKVISAESFDTSGVYTAQINAGGDSLANIALYKGNYYIRTDAAAGKWDHYLDSAENKFTEFAMLDGEIYDHYWVENYKLKSGETKINLQACVANDYNENLANKIVAGKGTNQDGDVTPDEFGVNIRFAYNPATNYFSRAIIQGSSSNEFLNIVSMTGNLYKDEGLTTELGEGATAADSKFTDGSNWTYTKVVYAKADASHPYGAVRIKAKAFNGDIEYLLGYVMDEVTGKETSTPANRTILASGTTYNTYQLTTFYDFKTNRIVTAWTPQGDMQIDSTLTVNANIMFVRRENRDAAHILLGENGRVNSLDNVYFVLELDRDTLTNQEGIYWFSLPFDCKLSQVFGVEGYASKFVDGKPTEGIWGIQYYDGAARAKNGFWMDSESYFKWFTDEEYKNPETTLKAGEGYVLSFDKSCATWKEYEHKAYLRLYFPSQTKGFDMRPSTALTKEYPDQPCTITRDDRDKKDGNWKIIGSCAYNNSTPQTLDPSAETQAQTYNKYPNFLYEWTRETIEGKHFHAVNGTGYTYHAFFGYRVQFGGTITWLPQTETYPETPGIAARRHAAEGEKAHITTRLELQKADGTKTDQTFIALDLYGTTGYDQNMDLGKITGSKQTTIYTTSENVDYAGNTLPMESQTVDVTVNTKSAGTYSFAMPDGTEGLEMILIDSETGTQTDLASGKYTVSLGKGNFADRFSIRINIKKTPTELQDAYNADGSKVLKYIENEQLYILREGRIYDAQGRKK